MAKFLGSMQSTSRLRDGIPPWPAPPPQGPALRSPACTPSDREYQPSTRFSRTSLITFAVLFSMGPVSGFDSVLTATETKGSPGRSFPGDAVDSSPPRQPKLLLQHLLSGFLNWMRFWEPMSRRPFRFCGRQDAVKSANRAHRKKNCKRDKACPRKPVDGVILPCHWGCRQGTGARGLVEGALAKEGIPSLTWRWIASTPGISPSDS